MKRVPLAALAMVSLLRAGVGAAAEPPSAVPAGAAGVEDARRHYRRGVDYYNDHNYTAALVEFRRAYDIAPNANVLYNIGRVQFLLPDYASALTTFEKFLRDGGDAIAPDRRAEVEQDLVRLRERVAHVDVHSNVEGAEIVFDDTVVGRTPLTAPLIANIGALRVSVRKDGREIGSKRIELASGDQATVSIDAAPAPEPAPPAPPPLISPVLAAGNAAPITQEAPPSPASPWIPVTWTVAGAMGAGGVVTGILAVGAANDLAQQRKADGTSRATLDATQSKTKSLALATDVLGVAAVATAGIALYLTLSSSPARPRSQSAQGATLVLRWTGTGLSVTTAF